MKRLRIARLSIEPIDWEKQGELLAQYEASGTGKGTRERAKGNPKWDRQVYITGKIKGR